MHHRHHFQSYLDKTVPLLLYLQNSELMIFFNHWWKVVTAKMNFFPLLFNYYANVALHVIVLRLVFFKYIICLFMFFSFFVM